MKKHCVNQPSQSPAPPSESPFGILQAAQSLDSETSRLLYRLRTVLRHLTGACDDDGDEASTFCLATCLTDVRQNLDRCQNVCFQIEIALGVETDPTCKGVG